jgi:hypothetical protein
VRHLYAELRGIQTKPFNTLIVALGFCFIMAFCNAPKKDGTVVVRVFRDSGSDFSRDLDNRLYSFNNFKQERHVRSGKLVFVATMEGNYRDLLGKIALIKPQMIILDSSADAQLLSGMQVDLTKARNACGANGNSPRSFLLWVSGEELEAANILFDAIARPSEVESPPAGP